MLILKIHSVHIHYLVNFYNKLNLSKINHYLSNLVKILSEWIILIGTGGKRVIALTPFLTQLDFIFIIENFLARVKKSESYSVNLHDGFPGKSMKNVPNIRLFSRIYTKKIHLSYFTFDSVIRTAYTYNSIKKIIDLDLFLIRISIRSILVKY